MGGRLDNYLHHSGSSDGRFHQWQSSPCPRAQRCTVSLWATGVLTLEEAFSGFGDPTVVFIVALFIAIEALNSSGVTAWIANFVAAKAGGGRTRLIVFIGVTAAIMGAFISVSGTVGALLPVVVVAVRAGMVPSKMLIPLAFQRAVPLGKGAKRTLAFFALLVVLLATGLVPPPVATMLAAAALLLMRVIAIPEVYRAVPWTIVILVGGMIPLSHAFIDTGAAGIVSDFMLTMLGSASPHLALLAICVLSMTMGQFMSNLATVLVMMPIAIAVTESLGTSPMPFMMGLAI